VISKILYEDVNWILLINDRNHWRAFMKTIINLGSIKDGEYLIWLLRNDSAPLSYVVS
jgi:hypothetical protein